MESNALPGIHNHPQAGSLPRRRRVRETRGGTYRLTIAAGGQREQVDHALHGTAIERNFAVVVSADDVATGKPGPAIYHATLTRLTAVNPRPPLLIAAQYVVVEDSRSGIRAVKASGMKVLALGACPTLPFVTRRRRCGQCEAAGPENPEV